MPAPARSRTVHVHGAEVSTDQDALGSYAETIALLIAIVAFLAAAWIAAAPRDDADLTVPAVGTGTEISYVRAPDSTRDVVSPDVEAAESTAVTTINPRFTIVDE